MILSQTRAMFVDAFRELHARKLFWITLALSLVVILAFAPIGIEPGVGISYAMWDIPGTAELALPNTPFLRDLLIDVGIGLWLTWFATIIALISTADIIPSMVRDGAIDTMLSKPIGRIRLFLTKYMTGLLFVGLQVAVFCIAALLLLGIKTGDWEPRLLLGIPIVVLFFSYLFCISAFVGLLTKSALTAVLLTGLFWGLLIGVNRTDEFFGVFQYQAEYGRDFALAQIEFQEQRITDFERSIAEAEEGGEEPFASDVRQLRRAEQSVTEYRIAAEEEGASAERLASWRRWPRSIRAPFPKTAETVALLSRYATTDAEAQRLASLQGPPRPEDDDAASADPSAVPNPSQRMEREQRSTSLWWIIGTSLGFEGVLLLICCVVFARRDF